MKHLLLTIAIVLWSQHSQTQTCSTGTCVSPDDMKVIVKVLEEKKCLQTTQPIFTLDPITIVTDTEGRVYGSGADPHPYSVKMSWCTYDATAKGKVNLLVAKNEPATWGWRFRPKFMGSFLFVDAFNQPNAGDAVDVGILWDFFYWKALNLNVATGFRSAGAGVGVDLTRNMGLYGGYAFSWWTLKSNVQAGVYFSFW